MFIMQDEVAKKTQSEMAFRVSGGTTFQAAGPARANASSACSLVLFVLCIKTPKIGKF